MKENPLLPPSNKPSSKRRKTAEQNAQARLVLIQLQWLIISLMVAAIVWLGTVQKKLTLQVEERLKAADALTARMNAMDDVLFAMTPSHPTSTEQAGIKNSSKLIIVQLHMAQTLCNKGDYQEAKDTLALVMWQLENTKLDMAAPVQSALKTALKTDTEQLSALQTQNPWSADLATLKNVQAYLRTLDGSGMSYSDLVLHDARMLISLAIGAATLQEKDTLTVYLTETAAKLGELDKLAPTPKKDVSENKQVSTEQIDSLPAVMTAINRLLANPPATYRLTSIDLLQ